MTEREPIPPEPVSDDQETVDNEILHAIKEESRVDDLADSPDSEDSIAKEKQDATVSAYEIRHWNTGDSDQTAVVKENWRMRIIGSLKDAFTDVVGEDSESSNSDAASSTPHTRPWRATLIRFGPLSGLLAMCIALASIFAALGILVGSDTAPVANWTAPPSTYLAIFTAIANSSMRYATIQGIVIAWWVRAMRGSSLSRLHYNWRAGTSLTGALMSGRNMGFLGLACIVSTFVVIDGPLLQRASTVEPTRITNHPVDLKFAMAPEVPAHYTGVWFRNEDYGINTPWSQAFNDTIPTAHGNAPNNIYATVALRMEGSLDYDWYADTPMKIAHGCPGRCKAKLAAPALASTCSKYQVHANYSAPGISSFKVAPPLDHEAFIVSTTLLLDGTEKINLITGSTTIESDCAGTFEYSVCTLQSAIGEYEVTIEGDEVSLDSAANPKIIAIANNTNVDHTPFAGGISRPSTLGGIVQLSFTRWDDYLALYNVKGQITDFMLGMGTNAQYLTPSTVGSGQCRSYRDPGGDIMSSLNKLMVYTGMQAATEDVAFLEGTLDPGIQVNSTVTGYLFGDHSVFHTNYWWFLGAALVEIVCIALVAPTYWGWWNIGRPVSFSPLELAKAFESPILADRNSNSSGRDIAKRDGDCRVQYGVKKIGLTSVETKLAFADPQSVERPRKGERYCA